jgi:flavin reductase (DIM6/NTAB) family NADH-FMN oxidoreductase RutF
MFNRTCLNALLLAGLALSVVGCTTTTGLDSMVVAPTTASLVVGGPTLQMTAMGTYGNAKDTSTQNVTSQVTWTSAITGVATVNSSGVVTAVGAGATTITGTAAGFAGPVSSSATITVTGSGVGAGGDVVSLAVIPSAQSVAAPTQTSQFIAIGTTSSGATENLTGQVAWSSSSVQVATISSSGLATGVGQGTTTITAIAANADKTVATATATFTVVGGVSEQITAITIVPGSQSLSATGQTGQFVALGTSGSTGLQQDVTNSKQLKWSSSIPTIATVTSGLATGDGLAAGVSAGTTTITAEWTNPDNSVVANTASVTVSATAAPEPLLSIAIIPSLITDNDLLGTGQFLAYGTFSTAPTVMDITNGVNHNGFTSSVTWISVDQDVFPISSSGTPGATAGLVTAVGSGNSDIYAVATNPDGTLVYSPPATFNCPYVAYVPANPNATPPTPAVLGSCNEETIASGLLVTLTVFNAGLNTTDWLITAPSATGTPDVIHCGPGSTSGGSVCTATYPLGTTVTLTAPAGTGAFGGWSWNCTPTAAVTSAGPNSCTVTLGITYSSNESVGAIFN